MMKMLGVAAAVVAETVSAVAIPNPSAVFCEKMGGESEIVTRKDGSEIGLCVFENGTIIEEWTLFRMFGGDKD